MGLFSGWQSAVTSVAQTVANLVGQNIVALSIRLTQATAENAVTIATTGARLKLSDAGTTDYFDSDGSATITTPGNLTLSGAAGTMTLSGASAVLNLNNTGGEYRITNKAVMFAQGGATTTIRGLTTDTGGADVAVEIVNDETLTTAGDTLLRIRNGEAAVGTVIASVDKDGNYFNNAIGGTAGTGTVVARGLVRHNVAAITLGFASVQTGALTNDITLWTLPAKSRVLRVIADVTEVFDGGAISDCDVTVGNTAGGNQYLVSFDVDTAIGTFGDVAAEIGAALTSATVADVQWAASTVQARFTSVGANLSALTTGVMTVYVEYVTYP